MEEKKQTLDLSRDTIIFYAGGMPLFPGETELRPMGGSESSLIYLAKSLAKLSSCNVIVYGKVIDEQMIDGVLWRRPALFANDLLKIGGCQTLILYRTFAPLADYENLKERFAIKNIFYWTQDLPNQPIWDGFAEFAPALDRIILLSQFHKAAFLAKYQKYPEARLAIIGNAAHIPLYQSAATAKKEKGRCIYCSTPFRGLDVLLEVWPEIKKRVKTASLHIYSGMKIYGNNLGESEFEPLYKKASSLQGVVLHGPVSRGVLAEAQLASELMLYPNTFDESFCIAAAECIAAGTPVITSAAGALNETVRPGCGVLIDADPHSEQYREQFVKEAVKLLTNDIALSLLKAECLKQNVSWDDRAKEWLRLLDGAPLNNTIILQ